MTTRIARAAERIRIVWAGCLEGGVVVGALFGAVCGVLLGFLCADGAVNLTSLCLLVICALTGAACGMIPGALVGMFTGLVSCGIVIGSEILTGGGELPRTIGKRRIPTELEPAGAPHGRGDEAVPPNGCHRRDAEGTEKG